MLDKKILDSFTEENFERAYNSYKISKTDIYRDKLLIPMGVDGLDWQNFERNINQIARHACKRAISNQYYFSPFRELEVPKPPYLTLKEAKENNKTRVLSIATIKDVIFQKIIYEAIEEYCEDRFNEFSPTVSFAYRRGKSAPMAVREIYKFISSDNYEYGLDGDLKKFFDEIDHELLSEKLTEFFGSDNSLTVSYLRRFYSADRTPYNDYKGDAKVYYSRKPTRLKRDKGIPQGGVLSGLIANIFLYNFDYYVVKELYKKYDDKIKYIRYADDFVILFKNKEDITPVYNDIREYLQMEKLTLHELGEKSKEIDMSVERKEKLEFLGYVMSPKGISIKKDNITKFKKRITEKVKKTKIYRNSPEKGLSILIEKLNYKIIGNLAFEEEQTCTYCNKELPKRNWLSYFLSITDVRRLRSLDIWIRKEIYKGYYHKTNQRLNKNALIKYNLPSLERMYYQYKKDLKREKEYCNCNNGLNIEGWD